MSVAERGLRALGRFEFRALFQFEAASGVVQELQFTTKKILHLRPAFIGPLTGQRGSQIPPWLTITDRNEFFSYRHFVEKLPPHSHHLIICFAQLIGVD